MKSAWLAGGIVAVLVGMGLVMPAIALLRDKGALPTFEVGCLLLGIALTLSGAAAAARGARTVRA
jgi:hypothetical protein